MPIFSQLAACTSAKRTINFVISYTSFGEKVPSYNKVSLEWFVYHRTCGFPNPEWNIKYLRTLLRICTMENLIYIFETRLTALTQYLFNSLYSSSIIPLYMGCTLPIYIVHWEIKQLCKQYIPRNYE